MKKLTEIHCTARSPWRSHEPPLRASVGRHSTNWRPLAVVIWQPRFTRACGGNAERKQQFRHLHLGQTPECRMSGCSHPSVQPTDNRCCKFVRPAQESNSNERISYRI